MKTCFIVCGALGREIIVLIDKYGWDAEVIGVPAIDHVYPDRIAPDVERKILAARDLYEKLIVIYGDCGTSGKLDKMLARYPEIVRIAGPHCYEMYGGETFNEILREEPGSYILTDFMVRKFQGLILKSMGLDCFPELKKEYFKNYKRIIYLAQTENAAYRKKAHKIASYLELPLEIRFTGYGFLEERLVLLMAST